MEKGTVKWFNDQKGYGFIEPTDGSRDVFVHHSNIESGATIGEGDRVEFDTRQGQKGREAILVRPAVAV